MQPAQEHLLLDQALAGLPAALERLVAAHAHAAHNLAFRMLRSREDAEEVVQDAFLKAFARLGSFQRQSRFSTWLYRIVYTTALNRAAGHRPLQVELDTLTEADASLATQAGRLEGLEAEERRRFLDQALAALPPEDRALVTLHYYEERPLAEIAEIAGLSAANVKVKLHRARRKLAATLETLLGPELPLWKSRT